MTQSADLSTRPDLQVADVDLTAGLGVDLNGAGTGSTSYYDFGPHLAAVIDGAYVAGQPCPLAGAEIGLDAGIASVLIQISPGVSTLALDLQWRFGLDSVDPVTGALLRDAPTLAYGVAQDPTALLLMVDGTPVSLVLSTVERLLDNGDSTWDLRIDSADGAPLDSALMQGVLRQVGVAYVPGAQQPSHGSVAQWSVQVSADGSTWVGAQGDQAGLVQIGMTDQPPVLVAAFHQEDRVNLHFESPNWQGLDSLPDASSWFAQFGEPDFSRFTVSVTVDGQTEVYGLLSVGMNGGVQLTLDRPIPPGAVVSVRYDAADTDQASGVVQDWVGNDASSGEVVSQAYGGLQFEALSGASFGLPDGMLNVLSGYESIDAAFANFDLDGVVTAEADGRLTIEFRPSSLVANPNFDVEATEGLASQAYLNLMLTVEIQQWDGMGWHQGDSVVLSDLVSRDMGLMAYSSTLSWLVAADALAEPTVIDHVRVSSPDGDTFSLWASLNESSFWGNDVMLGSAANDRLRGDFGNDTIDGGAGADAIDGGRGNDQLDGGDGNDTLVGAQGDDQIQGGGGNDVLVGGGGDDFLDGGRVTDRVSYSDGNSLSYATATQALTLDLRGITGDGSVGVGTVQSNEAAVGNDTVANVNFITTGAGNDTIYGSNAEVFEMFNGGAGNDTIDGGTITDFAGNRVNFQGASVGVQVDLSAGTADALDDTVAGNSGHDRFVNINQVRATAHDDLLVGSNATAYTELYEGLQGDDVIDGQGGFDIVRFDAPSATSSVVVDLALGIADGDFSGHDSLVNIEGVFGSNFDDLLTGGLEANGADYSTASVKEVFRGAGGNDTLDGGVGFDRADYAGSLAGVEVHLSWDAETGQLGGWAQDGLGGLDELRAIEQVRGSDFDDLIVGSDRNTKGQDGHFELLEGRAGRDTLDGGAGFDLADYGTARQGVTVSLATGRASQDGYGDTDVLTRIEGLRGSAYADLLRGSLRSGEYLEGGAGNDTLDGGAGSDRAVGGVGDDLYLVDHANDLVVEAVGQGTDTVRAAVSHTLGANVERLQLVSGNLAINGTGNTLANTLLGNGGANVLDGATGADTLSGYGGNDTYVVDNTGDVVIEVSATGGSDTVQSSISYALGANVEHLTLTGGGAINATGNGSGNYLTGNSAANVLDGGLGTDTLDGGLGNDTYVVDNVSDSVLEYSPSGGIDTVFASVSYGLGGYVEHLTLTGSTDLNATGNQLANQLTGNAGRNTLDGGTGADTLTGGRGDDTYVVDSSSDVISELAGEGSDTVVSSAATFALAANVENGRITSSGTAHLTGNAAANVLGAGAGSNILDGLGGFDSVDYGSASSAVWVSLAVSSAQGTRGSGADTLRNIEGLLGSAYDDKLTGNAIDNLLVGGGGADVLAGGAGNDTLTGGLGSDTFRFEAALNGTTNVDTITDYNVPTDVIALENAVFTKLVTTGTLAAANFASNTAGVAMDANDYLVYDRDGGQLYYDADGNGAGAAVLIAVLAPNLALAPGEFVIT